MHPMTDHISLIYSNKHTHTHNYGSKIYKNKKTVIRGDDNCKLTYKMMRLSKMITQRYTHTTVIQNEKGEGEGLTFKPSPHPWRSHHAGRTRIEDAVPNHWDRDMSDV